MKLYLGMYSFYLRAVANRLFETEAMTAECLKFKIRRYDAS